MLILLVYNITWTIVLLPLYEDAEASPGDTDIGCEPEGEIANV